MKNHLYKNRKYYLTEFDRRKTAIADLQTLKKSLTIQSYNSKKRQQMLVEWAAACKCKWLDNKDLKGWLWNY